MYLMPGSFPRRHRVPIELQTPVESAHIDARRVAPMVLECRVVDHIDHRTHDRRRVSCYPIQQRLQPSCTNGVNMSMFSV